MNILVDIRQLGGSEQSGIGSYTSELLHALFRIDRVNTYHLLSSGRKKPEGFEAFRQTHIAFPNKALNATLFSSLRRLDQFVEDKIDLVFLPNFGFSPVSLHIPTVLTVHDMSWKLFPEYYSAKMRLWHKAVRAEQLIGRATRLIAPSISTATDIGAFVPETQEVIDIIPHGIRDTFTPTIPPSDHGIRSKWRLPHRYALFVGTQEPRKNLMNIIRGMEAYRHQSGDDLPLIFAGPKGWNRGELDRELAHPERKWIRSLGFVPRTDLPTLYRGASVTLWPSVYEGFGFPVLESMASGTPVITSHTSSLAEIAGKAAILVDPFRVEDITLALKELLRSESLYAHLRQEGIALAKSYSWEESAQKTLASFSLAYQMQQG